MLGEFGKCYKSDQFISLLTLWWGFLCFSVTHGHCQAWRQLQLLVGWVLAVLGDGDSLFPSCKYRLPFGLLCSSKENIDSSTGQVGLCTGNSTFALLLVNYWASHEQTGIKGAGLCSTDGLCFCSVRLGAAMGFFARWFLGVLWTRFAGKLLWRFAWGQIFVRVPKRGLSCRSRSHPVLLYHSVRSNLRSVWDLENRSPKAEKKITGQRARVE